MRYFVTLADRTFEVDLGPEGLRVDGQSVQAEMAALPEGPVRSLLLDGASYRVVAGPGGAGRWELELRGWRIAAEVIDERTRAIRDMTGTSAAAAGPRPVRAPMPGLVVRVEVEEGDEVRPGQGLVIVEAMKMENELRAEVTGRVKTVHVRAGQVVEKDQVLIDLGPELDG